MVLVFKFSIENGQTMELDLEKNTDQRTMSIEILPHEIWQDTLDKLSLEDLIRVRAVCELFHEMAIRPDQILTEDVDLTNPIPGWEFIYINLTNLNLSSWTEANVTDKSLCRLTGLKKLDLSANTLISNLGVSNLINLTDLTLAQNDNISDDALSSLTNLSLLDLSYCSRISNDALSNLTNLKDLSLASNYKITGKGISNLDLMSLDIAGNIKIGNTDIECQTNLTLLNLHYNNRISPNALFKLTKLKSLVISAYMNKCSSMRDQDLLLFSNLKMLDINENPNITDNSLSKLTDLTVLVLDRNKLITEKTLSHLSNLTILSLESNNKINDAALLLLTNLTDLTISNSKISEKGISHLLNLRKLDITRSNLNKNDISHLTNLTYVDYSDEDSESS